MKFLLAGLLLAMAPSSRAQLCPTCVQNTAAPQNAQINIGTATIRGTLVASSATITDLNVGTLNSANLTGNGAAITNLSASALASGVVAAARLVGSYTGITGVGTVVAGTWNGSVIGTQYGGTGQNFVTVPVGYLPYFSATGVMSTLAPGVSGALLQTNGAAAPSWTTAPQILGTNVTSIPLANLLAGTLPTSVNVSSTSLPASIPAASVQGNIPGGASFLTVPLPIANLAGGLLPTSNPASSITVTGVAPGTYGGPSQLAQITVRPDGRVQSISQFTLTVPPPIISTGPLPSGVTIAAADITTGTLRAGVLASSIAASGVAAGSYGDATRTLVATVQGDGRLTSLSQTLIALPASQITAGALSPGITIGAADIRSGALPGDVIASSLTMTGVSAGTFGGPTLIPQITLGTDGRVTAVTQFVAPTAATGSAVSTIDNNWGHAQTSQSSWTFLAPISATSILGAFIGDGSNISGVVKVPGSTMTGTLFMQGANTHIVAGASVTAGAFFGNGSGLTGITATQVNAGGIINGPLASSILPSTVAFTTVDNHFSASQTIDGSLVVSTNTAGEVLSVYNSTGNAEVGLYSNAAANPTLRVGYFNSGVPTTIGRLRAQSNGANQPFELLHSAGGAALQLFGNSRVVLTNSTGDTTKWLTVNGGDFCIGCQTPTSGRRLTIAGSTDIQGDLLLAGSSITLTGSNGTITSGSSVTASGFFGTFVGDGSGITGITPSTAAIASSSYTWSGDNTFLKPITLSTPLAVTSGGTDTADRTLRDSSNVTSVNWGGRSLINDNGLVSVEFGGGVSGLQLRDNSGIQSLRWHLRTLRNSSAFDVLDWQSSILVASSTGVVMNWSTQQLQSGGSVKSVDWYNRQLFSSANTAAISWSTSVVVSTGMSGTNASFLGPVAAASFIGNGSGLSNVAAVSVPASGVQSGTLGASVIASSVAATGVTPGAYGSATQTAQVTVGGDGRVSSASNVTITGVPAASVPASGVQAGTLGSTVIASSVSATGVTVGTYGSATQVSQVSVGVDGRVTSASNVTISGVPAATVPASGVQAGTLGGTVIASSVAATGVTVGSFGSATQVPGYTVGVDGRLSAASNTTISLTNSNLQAGTYSNVTVPAANVAAGSLGASVIASSIAVNSVGAAQLAAGAVSTATVQGVVQVTAGGTGATTASAARTNLVAAQSGANSDITSMSALVNIPLGTGLTVSGASVTLVAGSTLRVRDMAAFGSSGSASTIAANGSMYMASGSSLTLTGAAGTVNSQSSVTASGFFGDVSQTTGYVITVDSQSTNSVNVNSVTNVALSSATGTFRGGRSLTVVGLVSILNSSGATRTYNVTIFKDGVALSNVYTAVLANNIESTIPAQAFESSSSSGSHTYSLNVNSSSATGTQTADTREITVQEF